jgi:hypothetical protein
MKHLRKDDQLNIRMRRETKRKIKSAARLESERRGEIVEPGPLLLELGMPAIEQILQASVIPAKVA